MTWGTIVGVARNCDSTPPPVKAEGTWAVVPRVWEILDLQIQRDRGQSCTIGQNSLMPTSLKGASRLWEKGE